MNQALFQALQLICDRQRIEFCKVGIGDEGMMLNVYHLVICSEQDVQNENGTYMQETRLDLTPPKRRSNTDRL